MDQDAFRQLLEGSRKPQPNATQATITVANSKQNATSAPSEPAFKPRKVKKSESKYRDRAAERREGLGNDYAEVEAVLEDFKKRVAHEDKDVIEQRRKYLGGDSQHTILVKGLDMSLFEQNRVRAAVATDDDEILEQAFVEATSISGPTEPRKRTREDIIRDLKAKQQNGDKSADQPVAETEDRSALEAAKKAGKFRPIGFKPIGQKEERDKEKKRKVKDRKEGVKKKQKVGSAPIPSEANDKPTEGTPTVAQVARDHDTTGPSSSKVTPKPPEPEPAPLDEDFDFDIFAGAGDYEGFSVDEESEEENRNTKEIRTASTSQETVFPASAVGTKGWFNEAVPEVRQASIPPEESPPVPDASGTEENPQEIRLEPLESSALPSIRDFLAVDEAVQRAERRQARKEKKKHKKKAGNDDDDDD